MRPGGLGIAGCSLRSCGWRQGNVLGWLWLNGEGRFDGQQQRHGRMTMSSHCSPAVLGVFSSSDCFLEEATVVSNHAQSWPLATLRSPCKRPVIPIVLFESPNAPHVICSQSATIHLVQAQLFTLHTNTEASMNPGILRV